MKLSTVTAIFVLLWLLAWMGAPAWMAIADLTAVIKHVPMPYGLSDVGTSYIIGTLFFLLGLGTEWLNGRAQEFKGIIIRNPRIPHRP